MIFLSYDDHAKGYRLADLTKRRTVVSRDVKFLKEKSKPANKSSGYEFMNFDNNFEEIIENAEEWVEDENENQEEENENQEEENNEVEDDFQSFGEDNGSEVDEIDDFNDENNVSVEGNAQIEDLVENEDEVPVRRSNRQNQGQMPAHFDDYLLSINDICQEPTSYKEAMRSANKENWEAAVKEELKSINKNQTWDLVELPEGRKAIGSKWVFKLKQDSTGKLKTFKARLVAQGYNQKYGTDYDEVFAPVARPTTFRILLAVSAKRKYRVKHFDIKSAFLYGKLEEEIYMKQPPGFEQGNLVCKLKKSLYGLKQAARQWNQEIHRVLIASGCKQSKIDKCLYTMNKSGEICYVIIHVDDLLIAGSSDLIIKSLVVNIQKEFEVKDLGEVKQYLGIDVTKDAEGNFYLGQSKYIDKAIVTAGQVDARISKIPLDTGYDKLQDEEKLKDNHEYRKLIGMLLYISTNSRPDIAASVSILSQKVSNPSKLDLNEVKRLIRYLKGTRDMKLKISNVDEELKLEAYSDANWAENRIDRKSNSGYVCFLGGGTISWACRKQSCVSLSSTEAEYIALAETCQEVVWLRDISKEFSIWNENSITINVDNQSCMKMVGRKKFSNRTKHVDTKFHFISDLKEKNYISLKYCPTDINIADMLTKPLQSVKLSQLRVKANVV